MIDKLTTPEVQKFIRDHEREDERELALKNQSIGGVSAALIAKQISGRRKANEKLPLFYSSSNIIYPPTRNLEQCSSEKTAKHKCEQISQFLQRRESALDLTGGFGVDSFFFSQCFSSVDYVEPDESLLKIAAHNHQALGASNIEHHNTTAEKFLQRFASQASLIYVDPSRRDALGKTVLLKDCLPDVVKLHALLFEKTALVLIKASPLLDIKSALNVFPFIKKVVVLALENEVKELLFFAEKNYRNEPTIEAINIQKDDRIDSFSFLFSTEENESAIIGGPLNYLYEPNAAILKSGAFKCVSKEFQLTKIHPSTHFYTSGKLIESFPGRVFLLEHQIKPDAKEAHHHFPERKANVTTRNFPLSVAQLRAKVKLGEGGEKYLIAFSGVSRKFVFVAKRLQ